MPPEAGFDLSVVWPPLSCSLIVRVVPLAEMHYNLLLAKGRATRRALSKNSCATGLIVRFFRVTIPTGASFNR